MNHAFYLAILSVLFIEKALANSSQPQKRSDKDSKVANFVCKDKLRNLDQLFEAELFDAQMEGQILTSKFNKPVQIADVEAAAISLAKAQHYHGYFYGICPNGKGFTLVTPAPKPFQVNKIPLGALRNHCKSWRVDFAQVGLFKPTPIAINGDSFELPQMDGLLSLTCQPKKPSWLGPQQWYMHPTGKFASTIPHVQLLAGNGSAKSRFVNWLNKNREALGLGAVEIHQNFNISADTLSVSNSIAHNRSIIKTAAGQLRENGYHMIGENRVKGKDIIQMAKLLWMSPRHRELLLNPQAKLIGLNIKRINSELLGIIVLGETQSNYAKRTLEKKNSVQ